MQRLSFVQALTNRTQMHAFSPGRYIDNHQPECLHRYRRFTDLAHRHATRKIASRVMPTQPDPMLLALRQARTALDNGNMPVGATLEVAGKIISHTHNHIISDRSFVAHAENSLLIAHSRLLFEAQRQPSTIYTTLEPCLMCLSAAAHTRIKKIVYACPDPLGGAASIPPPQGWYQGHWPQVEHDPRYERPSSELIAAFSKSRPTWTNHFRHLLDENEN